MQYAIHPAADIFPMMTDSEYRDLVNDIRENGQREPVVIWKDKLLDGRNRIKACEELQIEPYLSELDEEADPIAWVISYNLRRRQLKQSQRAMIAAKMATLQNGQTKAALPNGGASVSDAATLLSVSPRAVDRAKHVLSHGSANLIEAVEQCEISVSLAEKLCKEVTDKREQARLVREGKQAIKDFITPPGDYVEQDASGVESKVVMKVSSPVEAMISLLKHYDIEQLQSALDEVSNQQAMLS